MRSSGYESIIWRHGTRNLPRMPLPAGTPAARLPADLIHSMQVTTAQARADRYHTYSTVRHRSTVGSMAGRNRLPASNVLQRTVLSLFYLSSKLPMLVVDDDWAMTIGFFGNGNIIFA